MNKIIPPLNKGSQGQDVANLFEVLQFLVKKDIILIDEVFKERFAEELDNEISENRYGDATAQLIYLFREQYGLLQRGRQTNPMDVIKNNNAVDQPVADKLNELLKESRALIRRDPSTLKPGMQNKAVKELQNQLQKLGFELTDISGYFGRTTRKIVQQFQQRHNLEATGIVNEETAHTISIELEHPVEEKKFSRRSILNKEEILNLEKRSNISPLDLKISDPETFAHLHTVAVIKLKGFLEDHFKNSPAAIREKISEIDVSKIVAQQIDLQPELLRWIEEPGDTNISKEELAETKIRIEQLEQAAIPQNPLDIDESLEKHPLVQQEIQQARLYRLSDAANIADDKVEVVLKESPGIYTLDDELMVSLVEDEALTKTEAKDLGLAVNLYQLFDQDIRFTEYFMTSKVKKDLKTVKEIKDLIGIEQAEWEEMITQSGIILPEETNVEKYSSILVKRIERLYPGEALQRKFTLHKERELAVQLDKLQTLFNQNKSVFGGQGFQALDTNGLTASNKKTLQAQYLKVEQTINSYPGMQLEAIFEQRDLTGEKKVEQVQERIGLLNRYQEKNSKFNLLALDYMPESSDISALNMKGFSSADKKMIFSHMKARQRVYTLTGDAGDTKLLMGKGYHSAVAITLRDFKGFQKRTGLDDKKAEKYYKEAEKTMVGVATGMSAILDLSKGGFPDISVSNIGPDISEYLKKLDGYKELFGNQTYCDCQHCRSVLSPSAYFVDLMKVVEEQILDHSFKGMRKHALHLKNRRPDLWKLELSCKNTDTLVATLDLINEILENYIFTSNKSKNLMKIKNRQKVEKVVYGQYLNNSQKSFRQPFCLPLEKLRIYLEHFKLTRADVALLLEVDNPIQLQGSLEISQAEYKLITKKTDNQTILNNLYGIEFNFKDCNAQKLLRPMGLSRKELGQLVTSKFVTVGGADISIMAEKINKKSIQNDIERIYGLSYERLDSMHRFTRLWGKLEWSISELDLVLSRLEHNNLSKLDDIVTIIDIQKQLNLSVEQVCVLWGDISDEAVQVDKGSLLTQLFNMPPFGEPVDSLPKPEETFLHPSFTNKPQKKNTLQRMLAGLGISDEALIQLISYLGNSRALQTKQQDAPVALPQMYQNIAYFAFLLNLANLSLLYRHALLSRQLKLTIAELFTLIDYAGIEPAYIKDLNEVTTLLKFYEFYGWWKEKDYTLDDITFIQGINPEKPDDYPDAKTIAGDLIVKIQSSKSFEFADTLFALIPELTEEDSRKIIKDNKSVIESADSLNVSYRVSAKMSTVTSLNISLDNIIAKTKKSNKNEAEKYLQQKTINILLKYHASKLIPIELAAKLNLPIDKTESLIAMTGIDLFHQSFTHAMHGNKPQDAAKTMVDLVNKILPLSVLFRKSIYDKKSLDFIRKNKDIFSVKEFNSITIESIKKFAIYEKFADISDQSGFSKEELKSNPEHLHHSLKMYTMGGYDSKYIAAIAKTLQIKPVLIASIINTLKAANLLPKSAPEALQKIELCSKVAKRLGVGGDTLRLIVSDNYDDLSLASDALLGAFCAKYSDDKEWKEKSDPFEDLIRSRKRDGLADYLIHNTSAEIFSSEKELYQYFLIDVELTGCARTSRLVAAMSSLQLYVHRVLMNLEQSKAKKGKPGHLKVKIASGRFIDEWKWRKNYRVWEANRKVFLFPETYIEPELRDNKTPLFKELESTLLQQEVSEQNVLDTYAAYMTGFEEVARLKIAGSYHDKNTNKDILHLFGVTPSDPPIYYYRAVENAHYGEEDPNKGIIWKPWKKIEVQIPVRKVSPIVFQGRLYVFWLEIVTTPENKVVEGTSTFVGYKHKLSVKFTILRLDNTWKVPQEISLPKEAGVVNDLLESDDEKNIFLKHLKGLMGEQKLEKFKAELKASAPHSPSEIFDMISKRTEISSTFLRSIINKLFIPKYDSSNTLHLEPHDDYTLSGILWDQVYPEIKDNQLIIIINGINFIGELDLYHKFLNDVGSDSGFVIDRALYIQESIADQPRKLLNAKNTFIKTGGLYKGHSNLLYWHSLSNLTPKGNLNDLLIIDNKDQLSIINHSFYDCIIDSNGDILYLKNKANSQYVLKRLGTTKSEKISRVLFSKGVDSLLSMSEQKQKTLLTEKKIPVKIAPKSSVYLDKNKGDVNKAFFTGPYGIYYREIFFHIPFLIANHLNSQQKFDAAQKWYRYIFDPTANEKTTPPRDSNWRYLEFRQLDLPNLRKTLQDKEAIEAYKIDPFNPHAIARLRLTAYQKSIVMKYIDNLLDWGDKLFSRFTMESVNEATMLYIMASDILGDHPVELGECGDGELKRRDYENIKPLMSKRSDFLIEVENLTKKRETTANDELGNYSKIPPKFEFMMFDLSNTSVPEEVEPVDDIPLMRTDWKKTSITSWNSSPGTEHTVDYDSVYIEQNTETSDNAAIAYLDSKSWANKKDAFHSVQPVWRQPFEMFRQAGPVFCFPVNKELISYWDRVDDRLYKIRHCMDIKGVRRKLELFAPEIDPRLLVRAKAAGLSIEDVMNTTSGDLPPYRFEYLIQKAQGYAGTVQSFGSSLLSALEKKDVEELNRLRLVHEQNILKLTTKIKEREIKIETESIETIRRQQKEAEYNKLYYVALIGEGLIDWENVQQDSQILSSSLHGFEAIIGFGAAVGSLNPQYGSPFSLNFGGKQLGSSFARVASSISALAKMAEVSSSLAGLQAGNKRREQSWKHQLKLANHSLKQIEKKLVASKIKKDIAIKSLVLHKKSIEQTEEMFKLYGSKFSNFGLYTWLSKTLHGLYRDAYNSAFSMARLAEQAYQFERGYDTSVSLGAGSWDASKSGLLAGERLLIDLQHMEQRFIETNYRTMEIDQSFSLLQINPLALIALRETGECNFSIPELSFDLFYPGQYRRKIKAVRISIPCVTGPYINVGANLSLTGSKLRNEPNLKNDSLKDVPLQRSFTIATSKAQIDSGVFEFNFHDERYMPFEGAGAVESKWQLTLPKFLRQFDYDTISDVILHISYTAENNEDLRKEIEKEQEKAEKFLMDSLKDQPLVKIFSLQHDFSDALYQLKTNAAQLDDNNKPKKTSIEIIQQHFPIYLSMFPIDKFVIEEAKILLIAPEQKNIGNFSISVNSHTVPIEDNMKTTFTADPKYAGLLIHDIKKAFNNGLFGKHKIHINNAGNFELKKEIEKSGKNTLEDILIYVRYKII